MSKIDNKVITALSNVSESAKQLSKATAKTNSEMKEYFKILNEIPNQDLNN